MKANVNKNYSVVKTFKAEKIAILHRAHNKLFKRIEFYKTTPAMLPNTKTPLPNRGTIYLQLKTLIARIQNSSAHFFF
jgi:hypothetical protein